MTLNIFTDGGSRKNPGHAACSYVMILQSNVVEKGARYLGIETNNVAEYTGVIDSLDKFIKLKKAGKFSEVSKINISSDSNLLVNQLNGIYRIKKNHLARLASLVRQLEKLVGVPISYSHVFREDNKEADFLVNMVLDEREREGQ